jgi:hypothetical protein
MFLEVQELDCQHMRALNLDQMEMAQLMRDRLQMIDSAVSDIQVPPPPFGNFPSSPHFTPSQRFPEILETRAGKQQMLIETSLN